MKIKVTQDCIDAADFWEKQQKFCGEEYIMLCDRCPVAIALSLVGFPDASVTPSSIGLRGSFAPGRCLKVPKKMSAIIENHDRWTVKQFGAERMRPFSFEYSNGRITNVRYA